VEHGCARPAAAPLIEAFEVTPEALDADVGRLLDELAANDLVRIEP
jgi:hypothetical protein